MSTCYLNGEFMGLSQASISPMDRGFLFADSVYEVMIAYDGKIFCMDKHLNRLQASLAALSIQSAYSQQEWREILESLLAQNKHALCYIYIQVSRGVAAKRSHAFPEDCVPTYFAYVNPLSADHFAVLAKGVNAITMQDERRQACNVKSTALVDNVLNAQMAIDAGVKESILLRDGYAIEAASGNLFTVKDNVIRTTPLIKNILPGVTRDVVINCARQHGMPILETMISREDLLSADEVWLTSTTREVVSVIEIDGVKIGDGVPGESWLRMTKYFQEYKKECIDPVESADTDA